MMAGHLLDWTSTRYRACAQGQSLFSNTFFMIHDALLLLKTTRAQRSFQLRAVYLLVPSPTSTSDNWPCSFRPYAVFIRLRSTSAAFLGSSPNCSKA
uniref:Uncharacterized protein n=1 Tax=Hyaloperonospora arabidopsidis (strain Emoy2) TaxID=559515 RepID=M4C0J4_HYAAE